VILNYNVDSSNNVNLTQIYYNLNAVNYAKHYSINITQNLTNMPSAC
jgi:hypothetical protein